MKKILVSITMCLFAFGAADAQKSKKEPTTMDILTSSTWKLNNPRKLEDYNTGYFLVYGINTCFSFDMENGVKTGVAHNEHYYLSDTPDRIYDKSKEGKVRNGKYMIKEGILYTVEAREYMAKLITSDLSKNRSTSSEQMDVIYNEITAKYGPFEVATTIRKIVTMTPDTIILDLISDELVYGNGTNTYIRYKGKI